MPCEVEVCPRCSAVVLERQRGRGEQGQAIRLTLFGSGGTLRPKGVLTSVACRWSWRRDCPPLPAACTGCSLAAGRSIHLLGAVQIMRAPFQILVIPFRHTAVGPEYAVLKRNDAGWWQFVAGGGENDESPRQAAERETEEEIGIVAHGSLVELDSMATVPTNCFAAADSWGQAVYVIPEHCFAVDVSNGAPALSGEHTQLRWVPYDEASSLLKWDSNRNALWELNERLKRTPSQQMHGTGCRRR